jgi:hypothetical protein
MLIQSPLLKRHLNATHPFIHQNPHPVHPLLQPLQRNLNVALYSLLPIQRPPSLIVIDKNFQYSRPNTRSSLKPAILDLHSGKS